MKYGLRSDNHHTSKSKWKSYVENDITNLKEEVSTLKYQVRTLLEIINKALRPDESCVEGQGTILTGRPTEGFKYPSSWPEQNTRNVFEEQQANNNTLGTFNVSHQNVPVEAENMSVNVTRSEKQEELLSKIVLQLDKMDTKLNSVDKHLSAVDANLSDIRSQVSIMDSRLSGVDMFVTTQLMEMKWQVLKSSLQTLETVEDLTDKQMEKSELTKRKTIKCCDDEHATFLFVATENNIFKFDFCKYNEIFSNHPSANIQIKPVTDSFLELMPPKNKISTSDHSTNTFLTEIADNKVLKDNDADTPSENNCQISTKNIQTELDETDKTTQTINKTVEIDVSTKKDNSSEDRFSPTNLNCSQKPNENVIHSNIIMAQPQCNDDDESDYVIVEKSDVIPDQKSEVADHNTGSNTNYTVCNSITEYLEVNMGKGKDSVYEFGFEAKPDSLISDDEILQYSEICSQIQVSASVSKTKKNQLKVLGTQVKLVPTCVNQKKMHVVATLKK